MAGGVVMEGLKNRLVLAAIFGFVLIGVIHMANNWINKNMAEDYLQLHSAQTVKPKPVVTTSTAVKTYKPKYIPAGDPFGEAFKKLTVAQEKKRPDASQEKKTVYEISEDSLILLQ